MKKQSGFTLIELMTVVAIAAILVVVGIPSFTTMIKNNRLTTQANEFVAALNFARSEALRRGKSIEVTALDGTDGGNEWGKGWRIWIDDNGNGAYNAGTDTELRNHSAFPTGTTLDSTGGITSLTYQSTGLSSTADTFDLCDDRTGEDGRQIGVSSIGRVNVKTIACP